MVSNPSQIRLGGLIRHLIRTGLIDENQAIELQKKTETANKPIISTLITETSLTAHQIAYSASQEFGLPLLDLKAFDLHQIPEKLIQESIVRQHRALPLFQRGNRIYVAVSDPTNMNALDEIKFMTGIQAEPVLVEDDKLDSVIDTVLRNTESMFEDLTEEISLDTLDEETPDEKSADNDNSESTDDAPIVRYINKMLVDAIRQGASDIHFEPYEKFMRIRFRIDGMLHEVTKPPITIAGRLASRIKVMSRMDVVERRRPQDGRIKLKLSKTKAVDFRVNTLPTLHGEKIVLRILDSASTKIGIESLGFEPEQQELYLQALNRPHGMILVTGPTGSGKTVSLYTGLGILNTEDRNISTAEDPAEIELPGVNQVNVNAKIGLTFAEALRAFLRQDPDIIMVGEIRDLETAEIAIKAAQTGHLVLSTLHTNDAPQTLTRLMNMGVPAYNISNTVSLIIAQRLARRLCPRCKVHHDIPKDILLEEGFTEEEIGNFPIYKANPDGCDQCTNGYKGRVGIYQVLPISEAMQQLIINGKNALSLAQQAQKEGYPDLHQSGLKKIKEGITSLEEIHRVTTE